MNRPSDSPPTSLDTAVAALRLGGFVARCLAYPHEVLVRKPGTMGRDYRGRPEAALGLLVAPWLTAAVIPPTHGPQWIGPHIGLLLVAATLHAWVPPHGGRRHRRYVGDPWIGGPSRRAETLLGLAVGFALLPLCPTVGGCQLVGTLCSRWHLDGVEARNRRMVEAMKDAQMEAELLAKRVRRDD